MDLAKIDSGKIEITLEKVDCNDVIKNVVSSLAPFAETKGIALNTTTPKNKIYADTDRRCLAQILINLTNSD